MRFRLTYALLPASLSVTSLSAGWAWKEHSRNTVTWPRHPFNQPELRTFSKAEANIAGDPSFYSGFTYLAPKVYQNPVIRGGGGGGAPQSPLPPPRQQQFQQFRPSSGTSHSTLATLLDPLGIFFSQKMTSEPHRTLVKRKGQLSTVAPETPPPMVYFPEGGSGACEDFSPSGFNTYSFLSFLFSVANLIGLIANNVNNNINNNNDNNNDNNNNLDNVNVANSNSAQNNQNNVNIPAGMGRRIRREVGITAQKGFQSNQHLREEEEATAIVAKDFIRGMTSAMLISEPACAQRNLCEVNAEAIKRGDSYEVIAEVFSVGLVDMYPRPLPTTRNALLLAGSKGRKGMNCSATYPQCPDAQWKHFMIDFDLEDLITLILPEALTKEVAVLMENDILGGTPAFYNL